MNKIITKTLGLIAFAAAFSGAPNADAQTCSSRTALLFNGGFGGFADSPTEKTTNFLRCMVQNTNSAPVDVLWEAVSTGRAGSGTVPGEVILSKTVTLPAFGSDGVDFLADPTAAWNSLSRYFGATETAIGFVRVTASGGSPVMVECVRFHMWYDLATGTNIIKSEGTQMSMNAGLPF